jgi:hypothetical protein
MMAAWEKVGNPEYLHPRGATTARSLGAARAKDRVVLAADGTANLNSGQITDRWFRFGARVMIPRRFSLRSNPDALQEIRASL